MKVAIVGAGLSGLSTAIALRKYLSASLDLKIYDETLTHEKSTVEYGWRDHSDLRQKSQGAAISLQANALRVLRDLDPALADRIRIAGFPCNGFRWKTAGDWVLGNEYLDLLPISRPILVRCLQEVLPEETVEYRSVASVETRNGQRPVLHFQDGGALEFNLVVGADGIRSPVRKSLFGDEPEFKPQYCGQCAVGGVLQEAPLQASYFANPMIEFIQGPQGFFGYCALTQRTSDQVLYFSVFDSDLPRKGEKLDPEVITERLRKRHQGYTDPVLQQCLRKATVDNIYPIFYMPDLPSWGRDGVVLVGDAAHAMTPASGQGGSQAFEDAQTLALLLSAHLERQLPTTKAVARSIKGLYDVRHERTDDLKAKGLRLKEPLRPWSVAVTAMVYSAIFALTKIKVMGSMLGSRDEILSWDAREEVNRYLAKH